MHPFVMLAVVLATPGLLVAKSELAREDAIKLRKLMYEYRKPGLEAEQRHALIDEVRGLGEAASDELRGVIENSLDGQITAYQSRLFRAAQRVAVQKRRAADSDKIAELQRTIRELHKNQNVTKDQIKSLGDPALERLGALLAPTTDEAVDADKRLGELRQQLIEQADDWARLTGDSVDDLLAPAERTALLMALASDRRAQSVLAGNVKLGRQLQREESNGVDELNRIRLLIGLSPVAIDLKLCAASRDHSKDMHDENFFSHTSPLPGKKSPWDRARRFGTRASAENIAAGMNSGVKAIRGWWHSPGHFRNMLGNHRRVGLGHHEKKWTQMFG